MATLTEHCRDCERFLGDRCEPVHRWLDERFQTYGALHRFSRHHRRGVDQAGELFGETGRKAALIHILRDCGHIPKARDYVDQYVDSLGFDPKTRFNGYWDPFEFIEAVLRLIS